MSWMCMVLFSEDTPFDVAAFLRHFQTEWSNTLIKADAAAAGEGGDADVAKVAFDPAGDRFHLDALAGQGDLQRIGAVAQEDVHRETRAGGGADVRTEGTLR